MKKKGVRADYSHIRHKVPAAKAHKLDHESIPHEKALEYVPEALKPVWGKPAKGLAASRSLTEEVRRVSCFSPLVSCGPFFDLAWLGLKV